MTSEQDALVRKAVRARSLTDPLGAMGFRSHKARVARETQIRRAAFAATTLCFAGALAALISTSNPAVSIASQGALQQSSSQYVLDGTRSGYTSSSNLPQFSAPSHTRTRGS